MPWVPLALERSCLLKRARAIALIRRYHISLNIGPGIYFLPASFDQALKRGRRLNGAGVYNVWYFAHAHIRVLQNASPYLHQLIKDGSDIITINEHWLWPYQHCSLQNIHPDYDGLGVSDHRLNEHSELVRGCG